MKTIKCSLLGDETCTKVFRAETKEEMLKHINEHVRVAHTDMMEKSTPESMEKWNKMFDKLWHETPHESHHAPNTSQIM